MDLDVGLGLVVLLTREMVGWASSWDCRAFWR